MPAFLTVRHNIEVAHRLYEMPGKCENIHGHSMWVELTLYGMINEKGVLEGRQFADIKRAFRTFLDDNFDHHLLLNERDPWARPIHTLDRPNMTEERLPGLLAMPGDPTTENLARWIAEWALEEFKLNVDVEVHETAVNAAGVSMFLAGHS